MKQHAPKEFNGAKLVGVFEGDSDEWHEARAYSLGGSELGTILGLNPWESGYALWAKKTGKIEQPKLDNWAIRFGKAFEEPILKLWEQEHPEYEVYTTGTYQHPEYDYLHANPDALAKHKQTGEWIIVEVKTARTSFETLPVHYEAQVRHYMAVMGLSRAVVVAVAGMTWLVITVARDDFIEAANLQACARFMQYVSNDLKPDYDGSESTYEVVREQHPLIDEDLEVEIDGLHNLALAQAKYDEALAELNKQKCEVMDLMGSAKHAYVTVDGQKIRLVSRQARKGGVPYLVIRKAK